jgi:predicted nucleotidyltransferase
MPNGAGSLIPLAEIFKTVNELASVKLIEAWALGGALAAIYYAEPFTTYDADVFFIPTKKDLSAGIPEIYSFLKERGWEINREHLVIRGFPVQLIAASGLTEEAVREALNVEFAGVSGKLFGVEHLIAIAASVGRTKDKARIEQLLAEAEVNKSRLDDILRRHKLSLG